MLGVPRCVFFRNTVGLRAKSTYPYYPPRMIADITSVDGALKLIDDLNSKPHPFHTVPPPLIEKRKMPQNKRLSTWFRGQCDSAWDLTPSIFRPEWRSLIDEESYAKKEVAFYPDEHNMLHHFISLQPELRKHGLFDLLAISQHHSLPTRLLDWSKNLLSGLYFAVSEDQGNTDADGELFVLNPMKLNGFSMGKHAIYRPDHPDVLLRTYLSIAKDFSDLLEGKNQTNVSELFNVPKMSFDFGEYFMKSKNKKLADNTEKTYRHLKAPWFQEQLLSTPIATYPRTKDARLAVQQGVFTIYGGKKYVDDYVREENELPPPINIIDLQDYVYRYYRDETSETERDSLIFIHSYRIPSRYKGDISRQLELIGINQSSLFPEIDYAAKHVKKEWTKMVVITHPTQPSFSTSTEYQIKLEKLKNASSDEFKDWGSEDWDQARNDLELSEDWHQYLHDYQSGKKRDHPLLRANECGCTPFYHYASFGNYGVLQHLKKEFQMWTKKDTRFANLFEEIINKKSEGGWSPLYAAVFYDHTKSAGVLLEMGADCNARNSNGDTCLHAATRNGNVELVHRLLDNGADPCAQNSSRITPMHRACKEDRLEVVKALIPYYKNLNTRHNKGSMRTPFQEAVAEANVGVVNFLLDHLRKKTINFNVHSKNNHNRTAIEILKSVTLFRRREEEVIPFLEPFYEIENRLERAGGILFDFNSFTSHHHNMAMVELRGIMELKRRINDIKNSSDFNESDEYFQKKLKELRDGVVAHTDRFSDIVNGLERVRLKKFFVYISKYLLENDIVRDPRKTNEYRIECEQLINDIDPKDQKRNISLEFLQKIFYFLKNLIDENEKIVEIQEKIHGIYVRHGERNWANLVNPFLKEMGLLHHPAIEYTLNRVKENEKKYSLFAFDKSHSQSLLHYAVRVNEKSIVSLLLAAGFDIDHISNTSDYQVAVHTTPLYEACLFGATDVVELLLEHGANYKFRRSIDGWTPLHVAVWAFRWDMFKLLIKHHQQTKGKQISKTSPEKIDSLRLPSRDHNVSDYIKDTVDVDGNDVFYYAVTNFILFKKLKNNIKDVDEIHNPIVCIFNEIISLGGSCIFEQRYQTHAGGNIVHVAVKNHGKYVLDRLWKLACDKNSAIIMDLFREQNIQGATPLHLSYYYDNKYIEKFLKEECKLSEDSPLTVDGKRPCDLTIKYKSKSDPYSKKQRTNKVTHNVGSITSSNERRRHYSTLLTKMGIVSIAYSKKIHGSTLGEVGIQMSDCTQGEKSVNVTVSP